MSLITIDQLLESVDLDFEPRWVTKDEDGSIWIWNIKPDRHENWHLKQGVANVFYGRFISERLKLAEFDGKDWTECIYEVPRKTTEKIEKLGKLNVSSTNMTMNQNTVDTVVNALNQVIDAVNKHADIIQQIGDWGTRKGECLWCEKLTSVNLGGIECSLL